jgi:hypothetical protein
VKICFPVPRNIVAGGDAKTGAYYGHENKGFSAGGPQPIDAH